MSRCGARPDIGRLLAAVNRAAELGTAVLSPGRAVARLSGRCSDPKALDFDGHVPPATRLPVHGQLAEWRSTWNAQAPWLWITIEVPCRACPACLRARTLLWRGRAVNELIAAPRSWFGTLTLHPEGHALMHARACRDLALSGEVFEALEPDRQFECRHHQCGLEITKYLKRVRKDCGGRFRYLLVAEAHASGLPHYHLLVHEQEDGQVKHAQLKSQWRLGFTRWKLAEVNSSRYVTKYLTKSANSRVRASQLYGDVKYLTNYYALAA